MPRQKQSRGHCTYCGQAFAKGGMLKHLAVCVRRQEHLAEAERSKGKSETLYHLRVQDAWGGDFWLDLEMRGSATLQDLDSYLRAIWLECCGHMSAFYLGKRYGEELAMRRRLADLLTPEMELTHIYDFGTSSETKVKCIGSRYGKPTTPHPIALMARNTMPEAECLECGKPAIYFCTECLYEDDTSGTLCAEHAENHPHTNYGEPIPLVNSPRLGMCGYDGPAEPPY